jgi:hypothetical protein
MCRDVAIEGISLKIIAGSVRLIQPKDKDLPFYLSIKLRQKILVTKLYQKYSESRPQRTAEGTWEIR